MVITSTNINKTKQSLNSDGQKFHQYQQNEQSLFHFFFHNEILWQQNCIPLNCHDITVRNIVECGVKHHKPNLFLWWFNK